MGCDPRAMEGRAKRALCKLCGATTREAGLYIASIQLRKTMSTEMRRAHFFFPPGMTCV